MKNKVYTFLLIALITKNPLIKILLEILKPFLDVYVYYYTSICSFIGKTYIYIAFQLQKKNVENITSGS